MSKQTVESYILVLFLSSRQFYNDNDNDNDNDKYVNTDYIYSIFTRIMY